MARPGAGKQLKLTQSDPGEWGWKSVRFPPVAASPQQGQQLSHSFLGELKGPSPPIILDQALHWSPRTSGEGIFGGSTFGILVPGSKSHTLALLHPEGRGGDTLRDRVAGKSGVSTVTSPRTRLSRSPLSVLTARGRFICQDLGLGQKQPTHESGGKALTEARGLLIKEEKGQEEELRAPAGPLF